MRANSSTRNPGFTLVEILVVVAIIAVLVALSIGTLSKIRNSANQTTAMANIRQIQIANALWATDHNGKYVPSYGSVKGVKTYWYAYKDPGTGQQFVDLVAGGPVSNTWRPPVSILDPVAVRAKGRYYYNLTASFGYQDANMPGASWSTTDGVRSFSVIQVNNPARSAAFITATDHLIKYSGRLKWKVGVTQEGNTGDGMIAFRHSGKAAVVYYDGHVGMVSPQDIAKIDGQGGVNNVFWNGGAQ